MKRGIGMALGGGWILAAYLLATRPAAETAPAAEDAQRERDDAERRARDAAAVRDAALARASALAEENAALRAERDAARAQTGAAGTAAEVPAPAGLPDPVTLRARLMDALRAKDPQAFFGLLTQVLEAGDAGYPLMLAVCGAVMAEGGEALDPELMRLLQEFQDAPGAALLGMGFLSSNRDRLGAFMQYVLRRPPGEVHGDVLSGIARAVASRQFAYVPGEQAAAWIVEAIRARDPASDEAKELRESWVEAASADALRQVMDGAFAGFPVPDDERLRRNFRADAVRRLAGEGDDRALDEVLRGLREETAVNWRDARILSRAVADPRRSVEFRDALLGRAGRPTIEREGGAIGHGLQGLPDAEKEAFAQQAAAGAAGRTVEERGGLVQLFAHMGLPNESTAWSAVQDR